jgi:phosphoglucosamine mutase
MARKYFGTDGIRGRANSAIVPELALRVGQAAGLAFRRGDHRHRVVIGKDTRLSGYMIETAMVAGFTSVGMDVLLLGPMPTPAVAMLTRSMRADIGVMISASHNAYDDNGIKLFGPDGYKLSDAVEHEIEALIDSDLSKRLAKSADLGRATRIEGERARYIEFAKRTLPRALSLDGLRVVPPIGWCRRRCGSWAPTWCRSGSSPTASTSTAIAARPSPPRCAPRSRRCGPISASRSMATPIG